MTIFAVKVKPNSKQQSIEEQPDGSLKVHLKSSPVVSAALEEDRTSQSRINCAVGKKV
jgi:uncharacterized protein